MTTVVKPSNDIETQSKMIEKCKKILNHILVEKKALSRYKNDNINI